MSAPREHFHHCPRCAVPHPTPAAHEPFHCAACGFLYYFNSTIAVAAFLRAPDRRVLFIRRAKEPARGKLAVPGGFVDIGETAEEALRREIREEVNLEVGPLRFLGSHTNVYPYEGVTYPVLDFFFISEMQPEQSPSALDGVESFCWLEPQRVDLSEIAFPSIRAALKQYLAITESHE